MNLQHLNWTHAITLVILIVLLFSETGRAILVVGIGFLIYMIPYLIAKDKKKNAPAIGALNFFLGWTLIGWVIALVWALTKD